jgi:hypothetical protein
MGRMDRFRRQRCSYGRQNSVAFASGGLQFPGSFGVHQHDKDLLTCCTLTNGLKSCAQPLRSQLCRYCPGRQSVFALHA